MIIGLEKGVVRLSAYHLEWPALFEQARKHLARALGDSVLDIQHVGSTSIPGMSAKPIIDIGIAVRNFEEAIECIEPMESLGYTYRGENGIPRRHYFVRGNPCTHHIHMLEPQSKDWTNLVVFRDYLRDNASAAQEYQNLKRDLAARHPTNRLAYTDGKAAFILATVDRAQKQTSRTQTL